MAPAQRHATRLVVFDWDGTLMDSVGRIVASMRAAAQELNLPVPSEEAVRDIIGLSLQPALNRLFADSPHWHQPLVQAYRRHFLGNSTIPDCPLFPQSRQLLQALRAQGLLLAIATGKSRNALNRILQTEALTESFVTSRCADESESKPAPTMLLEILDELHLPASAVWMVGDSVHDMQMAKAAGVSALGVTWGVHADNPLRQAGADDCVSDFAELLDYWQRNP